MLIPSLLLLFSPQQAQFEIPLPTGLPESFQTQIVLENKKVNIELIRQSLRSENFVIRNSSGEALPVPPSRTYFGVVKDKPEINLVASLEERGILITVFMPDKRIYRISPQSNNKYTINKPETIPENMCKALEAPQQRQSNPQPSKSPHYLSPYPWNWKTRLSRIAFDATHDYWLREGQSVAGVTAGVEYQLAENHITCLRDAMVGYSLTGIVIRQTPYYTGTTSGDLLNEFRIDWDTNQTSIPRESAVLLDDYQGDGIAGLAWVGTLGGGWAYAGLFWDRGYSPGIIAHEIGHNWGCGHIDCWPWGGSAMCGSWLLYGPESTDIIQSHAAWLDLPVIDPFDVDVRPYADPDFFDVDIQKDNILDVLENDHDANFDYLNISAVDTTSAEGGTLAILSNAGKGSRNAIRYRPNRTRATPFIDTFWYSNSDFNGLEHQTPVTVTVKEFNLVTEWKFDTNTNNELKDTSGKNNDGTAQAPPVYAELNDPQIKLSCETGPFTSASKLFDNNEDSDFASNNLGVISAPLTQNQLDGTWIELDFGSNIQIEGIKHLDREYSNTWIQKSTLWFSDDRIFDISDQKVDITHHSHGQTVIYPFSAIEARYVRWEIVEKFDLNSSQNSLGGKELSFIYNSKMARLPAPTITLSSNSKSGHPPNLLIDNDEQTTFISDGQGAVQSSLTRNPQDGTWIEFDFGNTQNLEGLTFLDVPDQVNWTKKSRLWFSNNGQYSPTDPKITLTHKNKNLNQVFDFPPIQSQYLRWEIIQGEYPWSGDNGGRALLFFGDQSSIINRDNGPYGKYLEINEPVSISNLNANNLPTQENAPFTLNLFINPSSTQEDGTQIGGFGDGNRFIEFKNSKIYFAEVDSQFSPPIGSWTMLTVTFNGSLLKIYANGLLLTSQAITLGATTNEIHLAPWNDLSPNIYYKGSLDEFAIWNYALSETEINELILGGNASGPSPHDGECDVENSPRLEWVSGRNTPSHDLYFGTNFEDIRDATISSSTYQGRLTQKFFDLQNLIEGQVYFWKIDEVHNGGQIIPGRVWSFKTDLPWTTTIYEGFEDGANNAHLNGLSGGTGFSGTWSVPANNGYVKKDGSFSPFPSNVPLTENNGYLERFASPSLPMEGERDLNTSQVELNLNSNDDIYISFAIKLDGRSTQMTAMCGLKNKTYGDMLLLGSEGGEITIKGALGTVKGAACPTNTPLFIVGRIRSSTAQNDEIRLKVYNANTETVHASDGLLSGVGGGTNQWTLISSDNTNNIFDQLFIEAGGTGTTIGTHHALIDEIRIGETWSDVTGL